jgi:hypothetical protein
MVMAEGELKTKPVRVHQAREKNMICIDCAIRIRATIEQAKAHGWDVWVGGARCKGCTLTKGGSL